MRDKFFLGNDNEMKYVIRKKSKSHLRANDKVVFNSKGQAIKDWFLQKHKARNAKEEQEEDETVIVSLVSDHLADGS